MSIDRFKTKPRAHQLKAFELSEGMDAFAYLMDMGTGKTKCVIDDAARAWGSQKIDSVLVFAPKGVHQTWTIEQIPVHMPDWVRHRSVAWSSKPTKTVERMIDSITAVSTGGELRIFTMNWDAIAHSRGFKAAKEFCETAKGLMIVCDESQRIKNPKAERSKQLFKLRDYSTMRRIMSGSPLLNAPFDLFNQFVFLDEDIFGTTSFIAFKNEYADMMQPGNPLLDRIIEKRTPMSTDEVITLRRSISALGVLLNQNGRGELVEIFDILSSFVEDKDHVGVASKAQELRAAFAGPASAKKNEALKHLAEIEGVIQRYDMKLKRVKNIPQRLPQIVEKDKKTGKPKYKNLEKLRRLIEPLSYRVLKSECLDLPPKIYKKTFYELSDDQSKAYKKMKEEARIVLQDGNETAVAKLAALMKLSQICSGYVNLPNKAGMLRVSEENPKLDALEESLESNIDNDIKSIVWARFRPEIADIEALCERRGWTYATYNGDTKGDDRPLIVKRFEAGEIDVFIGEQRTGGTGITLVRAEYVGYYSNNFSSEDRQQSEDRAHRDGQKKSVVYEDFLGIGTIEPGIVRVLADKKDLSDIVIDGKQDVLAFLEQ